MRLKQLISFLLLCLFLVYIIPKEIFHAFSHHIDTEHVTTSVKNQLQISAEHHHCELMKADQQFVSSIIPIPYYHFQSPFYYALSHEEVHNQCNTTFDYNVNNPLRGPPSIA